MYYSIGWPKVIKTPTCLDTNIKQVVCNLDKIFLAILGDDFISIYLCKPCVLITFRRRTPESIEKFGTNKFLEWKPDSSVIVIVTSESHLIFYDVLIRQNIRGLYVQNDSPQANLRRDSPELFMKQNIPPLELRQRKEISVWDGSITSLVCINVAEIMIATTKNHILRYGWDGTQNRDYNLDLRRIPFCINKQVSKAEPIIEENVYVNDMEYSPLTGGFSIVLNDGRAAFLTASSLRFDPNAVQGIWAKEVEDATCASVNHKFRLVVFGRQNSQCVVYIIDEITGGLELSHECVLSSKDYPGAPGAVISIKWSPDSCAMVTCWQNGGIALWSTFGALLMCSLEWDYGLNVDLATFNPLRIVSADWSTEGYQLWLVRQTTESNDLLEMEFVKSPLSVNPCMSHQPFMYLQGDDRLYLNIQHSFEKTKEDMIEHDKLSSSEARHWVVISIPTTYSSTNLPIKYTAIDPSGQNIAIAGRTGFVTYSFQTRKWKLFGNETQEKDFIVTGGILWWANYIILGAYSVIDNSDELRLYPKSCKLDNKFAKIIKAPSQVLLINCLDDQLICFCADATITVYDLFENDLEGDVIAHQLQRIDISNLCVHSTCVVSIELSSLRIEPGRDRTAPPCQSVIFNVSGKLLMIHRDRSSPSDEINVNGNGLFTCGQATVLASNVENVWAPGGRANSQKPHLTEALWLACGSHGMRVWMPLYPRRAAPQPHAFISKRIMLPFHLKIYPLAILFEDAMILGVANDTTMYTTDKSSHFSLPFCLLERTTQVYLHQILRQLIRRNLGYNAWEIAKSCMNLSYFSHSLELLLHEVLEEEATSKEPIPDAQLPSIIEFISEFPVYLQTIVQCARKTEIALWPYLFSVAGKPKHLFQECMTLKQLDVAASYLIILQNLETSKVSRQYATLLLDTVLEIGKWELAKELVRFLRAIDPNDANSPRSSAVMPPKLNHPQQTPPMSPNAEDLSLVLGPMQVARTRSISTTNPPKVDKTLKEISPGSRRKKSGGSVVTKQLSSMSMTSKIQTESNIKESPDEFFIDVILQRHARRLLASQKLSDLGYFAAHLDFHLVTWLVKERDRAARVMDFVRALKQLHDDFNWPYPDVKTTINDDDKLKMRGDLDERLKKNTDFPANPSHVGDSGYMSLQGKIPYHMGLITPLSSDYNENPYTIARDAQSVLSGDSSVWADDLRCVDSLVPSTSVLEQLQQQIATQGSAKCEVQLRYLLQLFMEASCLEWSLIISILLRDAMAVVRTINACRATEHTHEAVARLQIGLQLLIHWTQTQCLGYKPFMITIQNQLTVLSNVIISKQNVGKRLRYDSGGGKMIDSSGNSHTSPGTRSRKSSSNELGSVGSVETSVTGSGDGKNVRGGKRDLTDDDASVSSQDVSNEGDDAESFCSIV